MDDLSRRQWLAVVSGATTAGLAGCAADDDPGRSTPTSTATPVPTEETPESIGGDGDVPAYASWIGVPEAAPEDDPERFLDVDLSRLYEHARRRREMRTPTPTPDATPTEHVPTDPLVHNTHTLYRVHLGANLPLRLADLGLLRLITPEERSGSVESPAEAVVTGPDSSVLSGSFDPAAVAEDLAERDLVEVDPIGAYDAYYDDGRESHQSKVVAFTDEHVLLEKRGAIDVPPAELRDPLERRIETSAGDRPRYHEVDDGVEWLLRTAGTGTVVVGTITEGESIQSTYTSDDGEESRLEFNGDLYEGARGVVHDLSFDRDDRRTLATAGLVYADEASADPDRLESFVGVEAEDSRIVRRRGRVVVEATYSENLRWVWG